MPTMITCGAQLLRINSAKNSIEYSTNQGRIWLERYRSSSSGTFRDLLYYGMLVFAVTSKGIYYSQDAGLSWVARCTSTTYGTFISLIDGGGELLAQTSLGLYYSRDKGLSWLRR